MSRASFFRDKFASSFTKCDGVFVVKVFEPFRTDSSDASREEMSEMLAKDISSQQVPAVFKADREELIDAILEKLNQAERPGDALVAVLGAGRAHLIAEQLFHSL